MIRAPWMALALLLAAWAPAAAQSEKRVALVIGNAAYQHVARLDNPLNDARLVAQTLRSLGFTLIGGGPQVNLDKASFDRAVQSFGNALQGADVGLFYYAGHGVQVRGSNYLVPVEANATREADVGFQMLDANLVLGQMEAAGTKLNLIILDACRNNPFESRGLRNTTGGLAQMQAPEGTLISFATQPGAVAQDGAGGNSPYTQALAQAMKKPGLDIFRTFNEVGLAVSNATRGTQRPWVSLSPIKGDFYFSGAPAPAPAVIAAQPPVGAAERAWAVTQSSTSIAVLEDFIRQFGNTPYASMAHARLDELRKAQTAVVAPPAQPRMPDGPPTTTSCAGNPNALGIARVVEVDTTGGPAFGFEHFKTHDFLRPGEVVLTFDDGPWPRHTPQVLAALAAHCTKAIFFPIGKHAVWEPGILKQVAAAGHAIGSHTWSHIDLSKNGMTIEMAKDEIEKGISAVHWAAGGPTAPYFRFPALRHPPELVTYLGQRNIGIFSTDFDSFDFKMTKPEQVVQAVLAKLKTFGKGIILMHDFQPATAAAMSDLLKELKAGGYRVVAMRAKQPVKTIAAFDEQILKEISGQSRR